MPFKLQVLRTNSLTSLLASSAATQVLDSLGALSSVSHWARHQRSESFSLFSSASALEITHLAARLEALGFCLQVLPYFPVDVVLRATSNPSYGLLLWLEALLGQSPMDIRQELERGDLLLRSGVSPQQASFLRQQLLSLGAYPYLFPEPTSQNANLVLIDNGDRRILLIKEIREAFGLGLKDAKAFTERLPSVLAEGIPRALAQKYQEQFESTGATCRIDVLAIPLPSEPWSTPNSSWWVQLRGLGGAPKIPIIKQIRIDTGLGLKEAKAASESLPMTIQNGLAQEEAEALAGPYRELGADVSINPEPQSSLETYEPSREPKERPRGGDSEEAQEPRECDVILISAGARKIEVLKLIRELTGGSLAACKQLADQTPSVIGTHLQSEDARSWKLRFEALGATAHVE